MDRLFVSRIRICFVIALFFLTGCATQKLLVPTGGSRADGTVKLSYEYGLFESPRVDPNQGAIAAKLRCAAWGYNDADIFGGVITTCTNFSSNGCNRWLATVEYQCTGTGTPTIPK